MLIPNAWDGGSAKLLAAMGFKAIATTSSGFAASIGRLDGMVVDDEALTNAAAIVKGAGEVPVSADLEHGYGDEPGQVKMTIMNALSVGLSGASIEDWSGGPNGQIYDPKLAAERVAAAASMAHRGPVEMVLTARAAGLLRRARREARARPRPGRSRRHPRQRRLRERLRRRAGARRREREEGPGRRCGGALHRGHHPPTRQAAL